MIELRLFLDDDSDTPRRLQRVLESEGLRIVDAAGAGPAPTSATLTVADDAERLAQRLEEMDRTIRELRNLDVAKSQFLANVSHELRTPLTAIVTYGEVLRDGLLGELNPRQADAVQSIIGSSRQLLSMIEDVLTYARASAAAIELKTAEFDLAETIRTAHQMNAALIRQKGLHFEEALVPELPRVRGDRDKVIHILGNLLGNAIEFTPEGGRLHVQATRCPQDPAWLQVRVADTGIGIAPEHHEMIFREFAQVDSSRARRHHGTGLGLAIARNFVKLHGGEIWVESAEGSRFFFTLPSVESGGAEDEA